MNTKECVYCSIPFYGYNTRKACDLCYPEWERSRKRAWRAKKKKELGGSYAFQKRNGGKRWRQKESLKRRIGERTGNFCKICGTTENLTLNHIRPRSIGGSMAIENLELLCLTCNLKDYQVLVKNALTYYLDCCRVQGIVSVSLPRKQTMD